MSQFRTISDLKTLVLQKSGEATNGNSAYDASALIYLNQAHQAIVAGGSILNMEVDEPWSWAKHRYPILLELQPAYDTGTVTLTNASKSVTFSSGSATSLEGWFLKADGERTVYRVTEHTAASTSGTLDMAYLGDSGAKSFKVFKLEYEIFPTHIVIDNKNDKLNFVESGSTELTATFTHGAYTPSELATHMTTVINAVSGTNNTYTVSYDSVLKTFSLVSNLVTMSTIFSILGSTGTNKLRSILQTIGLAQTNHTGGGTYTSLGPIYGISRLIEPFRIYHSTLATNPLVESTDPITMDGQYPLADVMPQIPRLFAKIHEDNTGSVTVRFNSYPAEATKCEINWIPTPQDLQDNAASIPLIPRKDIDCLIHGAAALILADKNDSKAADMLKLAGNQLNAMRLKNRGEKFRTGNNFMQIIPRADMVANWPKQKRYGYTADS